MRPELCSPLTRSLLLLLVACNNVALDEYETCSLDVILSSPSGAPGDRIVAKGTPYTEVRDTRVEVGGMRAFVESVDRLDEEPLQGQACTDAPGDTTCVACGGACVDGACDCPRTALTCEICDECRDEAGCAPCGECAGVDLEASRRIDCFGDPLAQPALPGACAGCEETMTFLVPSLPAGLTSIVIFNRNGQSEAIPFEILASDTASTGDTASSTADTGTSDTADTGLDKTGDTGTPAR